MFKPNIRKMNPPDKHNLNAVDVVVEDIIAELTLDERVGTANLDEDEFRVLELTLGKLIRAKLDQLGVDLNKALMEDCLAKSGESLDEIDAATVILKEIWNRLRMTHRLRMIK